MINADALIAEVRRVVELAAEDWGQKGYYRLDSGGGIYWFADQPVRDDVEWIGAKWRRVGTLDGTWARSVWCLDAVCVDIL